MWFPPSSPHPHPAPQLPIGCHNQAASCTHASDVCQCLMKLYGFPFCSNCMHLVESVCTHLGYQMSLKSKLLSRALCTTSQFEVETSCNAHRISLIVQQCNVEYHPHVWAAVSPLTTLQPHPFLPLHIVRSEVPTCYNTSHKTAWLRRGLFSISIHLLYWPIMWGHSDLLSANI